MKNITLKKLQLINFRNITNNTYLLDSNRVGIAGKNRIGKTNTILAIHWLLTDKMLDGSSDVMSIKPLHDTSLKVEVKATFDIDGEEITILKTYQEEWTKTRGTDELKLTGNITEYYINDIPYKVNKALEEMQSIFGLDNIRFSNGNKVDSKINVNAMLINPLYLTEILTETDEKVLRNFVVNLCGDVKDEDVFEKENSTIACKDVLEKYRGDHSYAMKYLKQQIKDLNEKIDSTEAVITELQKDEDVSPEDLKNALKKIEEINLQIAKVKEEKTIENPKIKELKTVINSLKDFLLLKQEEQYKKINNERVKIGSQISLLEDKKKNIITMQQRKRNEEIEKENQTLKYENEIKLIEYKLESLIMYRNELRKKGKAIKDSEFSCEGEKCPNCGYVLNEEEIKENREYFEYDKEKKFNEVKEEGLKVNLQIVNKQKELTDVKQKLFELTNVIDVEGEEFDFDKAINEIENQEDSLRAELNLLYTNDNEEISKIKEEIIGKQEELEELESQELLNTHPQEETLHQLMLELDIHEQVKTKHSIYENTQVKISNYKMTSKSLVKELNNYETKLLALDLFIKTKLQMIDDNVAKVFGDIKIKLIKENIKEGSWQQICKPCIKGKNTLFANGSTSEKITTGLAIIECVKRVLDLSNLPIIFDEGEALDRYSIQELQTNSQVITALVNDNYETPTVVNLER